MPRFYNPIPPPILPLKKPPLSITWLQPRHLDADSRSQDEDEQNRTECKTTPTSQTRDEQESGGNWETSCKRANTGAETHRGFNFSVCIMDMLDPLLDDRAIEDEGAGMGI